MLTLQKLIIVEGMDNTGKTTLINRLSKLFKSLNIKYKVVKADNPCPDANKHTQNEVEKITTEYYDNYVQNVLDIKHGRNGMNVPVYPEYVILDRAYLSEYVYGQIYRKRNPLDITLHNLVIESKLLECYKQENIFLVMLMSTNAALKKNDDNKSLSKTDDMLLDIERNMFEDAYSKSLIDHKLLYNVVDSNDEWIDVLPYVYRFIRQF